MPIHLEPLDVSAELEGFKSVLIVSCPICPPMSLAMEKELPFIEFLESGLKTVALERHVEAIRNPLERRGVRTGVLSIYTPCPTMCIWTKGQRRRFLKRAKDYEAVLVLGCVSAVQTARETLEESDCQVIQGMRAIGIANATLEYRFPMTLVFRHAKYVGGDEAIESAQDERTLAVPIASTKRSPCGAS
jgi:hypothetical protein